MPGYKGHLIGGALVGIGLTYLIASLGVMPLNVQITSFICILLGSLFPDIDIKSKGQKLFFSAAFIGAIFFVVQARQVALGITAICMIVPLIVRHRGLTHQVWFVLLISASVALIGGIYMPSLQHAFIVNALFFSAGALSHIFLDAW